MTDHGNLLAADAIHPVPSSRRQRWMFLSSLIVLALASSWTGVFNDFVYDDRFIILNNGSLHDLANWWRFFGRTYWPVEWGTDGYRPLTILAFSLEWAASHGRPWLFHAVNVGLYAAVSVAVFSLAETFLPITAAWVSAALFAVHPVHVEAVAYTVGQAELLAALCVVSATKIYIRGRNANDLGIGRMTRIAALYAAACLIKEHGIVLPATLLVAEVLVVRDARPLRQRLVKLRPFVLSLGVIAALYLWAHSAVNSRYLGGFHPYHAFRANARVLTMFGLVPHWVRLLLWPVHLSAEYGPPAFPVAPGFAAYQVPGMFMLVGILALGVIAHRRVPGLAFGIFFAAITLLPSSNFILPAGILLAERTLFLPSVGVMIAIGAALSWAYRRAPTPSVRLAGLVALPLVLVVAAWRSTERTRVWRSNDALFETTVLDAPNVYRAHLLLGMWRFDQRRMVEGERELRRAIALYQGDAYLYYLLGEEYRKAAMFRPAIAQFETALLVDPEMAEARARLSVCLASVGRWREAKDQALMALQQNTISVAQMRGVIRLAVLAAKPRDPQLQDSLGASRD